MDIDYRAFKLEITPLQLAQLIDHTKLNAWEGPQSIIGICKEAIHYKFYSVCVNSSCQSVLAPPLFKTPPAALT